MFTSSNLFHLTILTSIQSTCHNKEWKNNTMYFKISHYPIIITCADFSNICGVHDMLCVFISTNSCS